MMKEKQQELVQQYWSKIQELSKEVNEHQNSFIQKT